MASAGSSKPVISSQLRSLADSILQAVWTQRAAIKAHYDQLAQDKSHPLQASPAQRTQPLHKKKHTKLSNVATVDVPRPRRSRVQWPSEHLDVMLDAIVQERATGQPPDFPALIAKIGYAPEPVGEKYIYYRIKRKYFSLRYRADHGCSGAQAKLESKRSSPYPMHRRVKELMRTFPGYEATLEELSNALESDPVYQPHLDMRPDNYYSKVPRWKKAVGRTLAATPGIVKTGMRKGRFILYRYDAALEPVVEGAPAKRKHLAGPNFMGKHSKNAN